MNEFHKYKSIPSSTNIIKDFEDIFEEFRVFSKISDDRFYNLMVVVTEGINNASEHGNNYDPEKKVTVELICNNHELICKIFDQGKGYNPDDIEDPRDPKNLLKDSGRGVFLMRALSKSFYVENTPNGNIVNIIFEY